MQIEASFICDDIRAEQGNKISLMGLYDEKILLPQIPARVAKLCLFQKWSKVPSGADVGFELRGSAIVSPKRVEAKPVKETDQRIPKGTLITANLIVVISPVDFGSEGNLEILTFWEGNPTPNHIHMIQVSLSPVSD